MPNIQVEALQKLASETDDPGKIAGFIEQAFMCGQNDGYAKRSNEIINAFRALGLKDAALYEPIQ